MIYGKVVFPPLHIVLQNGITNLVNFIDTKVVIVYLASLIIEVFKVIIGIVLVKNGYWAKNIVGAEKN